MRSVARRRRGDRGKHTNAALSSGRARAAALRAHARRLCRRQDSDRTRRSHISILESAPGPCVLAWAQTEPAPKYQLACGSLPCLAALVRDVVTDAAKAIVRTALSRDARKIDRFARGPTKGGAIKPWPDPYVTSGLVVGEGLETTAAAATRIEHRGTLLQPAWALINRINLRDLKIFSGVEALTILVDNDESGDGQAAAKVCARQWLDAGCEASGMAQQDPLGIRGGVLDVADQNT